MLLRSKHNQIGLAVYVCPTEFQVHLCHLSPYLQMIRKFWLSAIITQLYSADDWEFTIKIFFCDHLRPLSNYTTAFHLAILRQNTAKTFLLMDIFLLSTVYLLKQDSVLRDKPPTIQHARLFFFAYSHHYRLSAKKTK